MNGTKNISGSISGRKKLISNIVVVLAALLIAFKTYSGQEKQIQAFKKEKAAEIEKNRVVEKIAQLEGRLNSYKRFLNKKDAQESITKLNDIARKSAVNIMSILPQRAAEGPYYTVYPVNLSLAARDYHTLAKFINELEKDNDLYLINMLNIRPRYSTDASEHYSELQIEMQISAVLYKD